MTGRKFRQRTHAENYDLIVPLFDGIALDKRADRPSPDVLPGTEAEIEGEIRTLLYERARVVIPPTEMTILAANNFGSIRLFTMLGPMLIDGVAMNLDLVINDTEIADQVDVALGTVATASMTFSNPGEQNILPRLDAVGATQTGTAKRETFLDGPKVYLPSPPTPVFLNGRLTTSTDITITFSGSLYFVYAGIDDAVVV